MTDKGNVVPARLFGGRDRGYRRSFPDPLFHRLFKALIGFYMRVYHRLEVEVPDGLPAEGPFVVLTSHFSNLDTLSLICADPYYPWTTVVVKNEFMEKPLMRMALESQNGIWVKRDGRDVGAIRKILRVLFDEKRGICIAAQGTRSRTGHLGSMDSTLMKLVLDLARRGVPVFPVAEIGTFEALPPGAHFPRPGKIRVVLGKPIDFSELGQGKSGEEELALVAGLIQAKIAELLPPEHRPLPGTPALGTSVASGELVRL